ncbi:MAG: hydrogenase expression/formation C-terminal domain-containing protein [Bdellovibrio bacteriovorus]
MSDRRGIPIQVDHHPDPIHVRGNALPILHEVRHALERLIATGETTQIDLNSIPFGPGDEARLSDLLGTGEVSATIDALGKTLIRETAITGVWLVDYRNSEDQRLALHVEIATVPGILKAQPEDLATAITALDNRLTGGPDAPRPES